MRPIYLLCWALAFGRGLKAKECLNMLFWLSLGHFWCSVVTLGTFSQKLHNFFKTKKYKTKKKKEKNLQQKSLKKNNNNNLSFGI